MQIFRRPVFQRVLPHLPLRIALSAPFAFAAAFASPIHAEASKPPATPEGKHLDTAKASADAPLHGAAADTTRTLRIGDVELTVPVHTGYLTLDQLSAKQREVFAKVVPPNGLLLDYQQHAEDEALDIQSFGNWPAYELYTLRPTADQTMSAGDWRSFKRGLVSTMARIDMHELLQRRERQINGTLDGYVGDAMRIEIGEPGRPQLYRDSERDLRFMLTLPNRQNILGTARDVEEVRVVAVMRVRGRLLFIAAAREFPAGKSRTDDVIAALDAYAERVLALNPADAP